jgi:hypothetical protein
MHDFPEYHHVFSFLWVMTLPSCEISCSVAHGRTSTGPEKSPEVETDAAGRSSPAGRMSTSANLGLTELPGFPLDLCISPWVASSTTAGSYFSAKAVVKSPRRVVHDPIDPGDWPAMISPMVLMPSGNKGTLDCHPFPQLSSRLHKVVGTPGVPRSIILL